VTAQLRSELRKMATTRTNLGLLLGLVALILFGVIAGSFGSEADLSLPENQRELIGNGTFAAVFAALIINCRSAAKRATFEQTVLVRQPSDARAVGADEHEVAAVGAQHERR
jgi:hypothetical protein